MKAGLAVALLAWSLPALANSTGSVPAGAAAPRIIGGQPAAGDWPWMARVETTWQAGGTTRYALCSGMLLTPGWVVTAAHCLFESDSSRRIPPANIAVRIGSAPGAYQWPGVRATFLPDDQTSASTFDRGDDIALLELAVPVTSRNATYPAIADQAVMARLEGLGAAQRDEFLTVLGWGKTRNDAPGVARTLQQARLDFVPFDRCARIWAGLGETLTPGMLCAGETNPQAGRLQDTCQGDSGGPLLIDDGPLPWVVGITSFGTATCASGTPSVYTRLLSEVGFIEEKARLVDLVLKIDTTPTAGVSSHGGDGARYYGTTDLLASPLYIPVTLTNHSLYQSATGIQLQVASDDPEVSASLDCPGGCTGRTQPPGGTPIQARAEVSLDALAGEQLATLTFGVTADQGDYRERNDRPAATLIFSDRPDLTVAVAAATTRRQPDGRGSADITLAVRNLSTVDGADADDVYLDIDLPVGTVLAGTEPELSCQGGRCRIGALTQRGGGNADRHITLHLISGTPQPGILALAVNNAGLGDFPVSNNRTGYRLTWPPLPASSRQDGSPGNEAGSNGGGGSGGGGALGGPWLAFLALLLTLRAAKLHSPPRT